jgi:hypothetical protein
MRPSQTLQSEALAFLWARGEPEVRSLTLRYEQFSLPEVVLTDAPKKNIELLRDRSWTGKRERKWGSLLTIH